VHVPEDPAGLLDDLFADAPVDARERFREVVPLDPFGHEIGWDVRLGFFLVDEDPRNRDVGPVCDVLVEEGFECELLVGPGFEFDDDLVLLAGVLETHQVHLALVCSRRSLKRKVIEVRTRFVQDGFDVLGYSHHLNVRGRK